MPFRVVPLPLQQYTRITRLIPVSLWPVSSSGWVLSITWVNSNGSRKRRDRERNAKTGRDVFLGSGELLRSKIPMPLHGDRKTSSRCACETEKTKLASWVPRGRCTNVMRWTAAVPSAPMLVFIADRRKSHRQPFFPARLSLFVSRFRFPPTRKIGRRVYLWRDRPVNYSESWSSRGPAAVKFPFFRSRGDVWLSAQTECCCKILRKRLNGIIQTPVHIFWSYQPWPSHGPQ